MLFFFFFFFSSRRRHTRWPRDWSSDVCSSDLFRREPVVVLVDDGHRLLEIAHRHRRDPPQPELSSPPAPEGEPAESDGNTLYIRLVRSDDENDRWISGRPGRRGKEAVALERLANVRHRIEALAAEQPCEGLGHGQLKRRRAVRLLDRAAEVSVELEVSLIPLTEMKDRALRPCERA